MKIGEAFGTIATSTALAIGQLATGSLPRKAEIKRNIAVLQICVDMINDYDLQCNCDIVDDIIDHHGCHVMTWYKANYDKPL